MAYGYWKLGLHERDAVFHLIFRKHPFNGNYAVSCGLETISEFLKNWHFSADDIDYLASLTTVNKKHLFTKDFLAYLKKLRFTCDVDAIAEGMIVFPNEPLLRIQGPLIQGQLLESTLLNFLNFQTLIATKSARVHQAAKGDAVIEFGMRRAQGADGALSASRAAYIGGCEATSNVLAGKLFDIPVRGTHAHSWVTAFPDEKSAFSAYANVMPHNCVLLVDTFDTLLGVKHAIEVGKELRAHGGELHGIRLDSGDLAALSIQARLMLDEAGFKNTEIIASNSLDEYRIQQLKNQDAQISVWGVGTHLVTAYDHPALDGVYKLSAIKNAKNEWDYKLKISEDPVKISNPGIHQVRRFFSDENYITDVIYDIPQGITETPEIILMDEQHTQKKLANYDAFVDLLVPVFKKGKYIYPHESIHDIRARAIEQTHQFIKTHGEKTYPVALFKNLYDVKQKLISEVTQANSK